MAGYVSQDRGGTSLALWMTASAVHHHAPFFILVRGPDLCVVYGPSAQVAAKAGRLGHEAGAVFVGTFHELPPVSQFGPG